MSNGMRISPSIELGTVRMPWVSSNSALEVISLVPDSTLRRNGLTGRLLSRVNIKSEIYAGIHEAEEGYSQDLHNLPGNLQLLQPISSETQFHQVIAEAQQLEAPLVIVWMAIWCRKCIYLKPKLEKLAADYYPRIRFYSIDVNNVSHKLVARAGVTKMPTIQVWKDGEKVEEVIGGHKAHLVVNEIREMIENEDPL